MAPSPDNAFSLEPYLARVERADPTPLTGRVVRMIGLLIESEGPRARVGDVCAIVSDAGEPPLMAEVVGFRDGMLLSVPLGDTAGFRAGARIVVRDASPSVPAGAALLGRVIDGFGRPLDGLGPLRTVERTALRKAPTNPLSREPVREPLATGVRPIDALLTCGR